MILLGCRKYVRWKNVPSKICPLYILVENVSVENMPVDKISRCRLLDNSKRGFVIESTQVPIETILFHQRRSISLAQLEVLTKILQSNVFAIELRVVFLQVELVEELPIWRLFLNGNSLMATAHLFLFYVPPMSTKVWPPHFRHRWITQFVSRIAASEVLCQVWDPFRDFEGLEIFEQS